MMCIYVSTYEDPRDDYTYGPWVNGSKPQHRYSDDFFELSRGSYIFWLMEPFHRSLVEFFLYNKALAIDVSHRNFVYGGRSGASSCRSRILSKLLNKVSHLSFNDSKYLVGVSVVRSYSIYFGYRRVTSLKT